MVLRLTVTPKGTRPPLPPSGDAAGYPRADGEAAFSDADLLPDSNADLQRLFEDAEPSETDDEDFEPALRRRHDEKSQLLQFFELAKGMVPDPTGMLVGMAHAGTLSDNRLAAREVSKAEARTSWMDKFASPAKSVALDAARGIVEAPRQMIGGARDAVQAAVNGLGAVGDWLNANVADLGTPQLFDDQGQLAPAIKSSAGKSAMPQLPTVKQADSVTGGAVRSVTQFLTGFVGAGKVLGMAAPGSVRGRVAQASVKGGVSDLAAFEAHEQRLADLVQQVPALQNPVTEYLSDRTGEGEIEGRFKRAVEGLGLGLAVDGLVLGLKAIRASRQATAAAPDDAALAAASTVQTQPRAAVTLDLLGDASETALVTEKAARASRATKNLGVPDDVAARAFTDRGLTPLGQGELYVNFARIDSTDDVKRVIADAANAFKPEIDAARRGVRTNAVTLEEAAKLDAWDVLLTRRKGDPLNAEQSVAVRQLWEVSGRKLMDVADVASKNPSPENLFQFRKMLTVHHAVQQEVVAARTETARALQSWRIPAGGSQEKMQTITDMIGKAGGAELNAVLASRIAVLKNVPNGIAALDAVVDRGMFARSVDAVKEAWIMALLSGPKTHIVNTMSNSSIAGQQIVERMAASRFSQMFGSGEVPIGEATAQWVGLVGGIRDGFRYAGKALVTGQSGYGLGKVELPFERAVSAANLGARPESWVGQGIDALGAVINVPGRALLAEDEFFKTVGYRMELHAQAFRAASRDVTDGKIASGDIKGRMADILANPPEHMRLASADAAAYQTFTRAPGTWVKAINRVEAELSQGAWAGQIGAAMLRFTIPFRNTPANILNYTFERTPIAPLTQRYRDAIAAGGAEADIARTRLALGSMTIMFATDLAMDGYLTGAGPEKKEAGERAAMSRAGWQPYSIKVGDRYFAYNRMDPIGFTLGIGADLAESFERAEYGDKTTVEVEKALAAATFSVGNNVLSKSYMRGMAELINAIMEPDRQGPRYVEKWAGSFMPTGIAETAKFVDPYMRATGDIVSKLKSRIPGLSSELPLARDLCGRARSTESGLGAVYDAVSPVYSRREDAQPIDRAMIEEGWFLNMPAKKVAGVSLANRPEVYSRYLELQGQTTPGALGDPKLAAKYGNATLLDTLNAIATGSHRLSTEYQAREAGDGREKFVRGIITAYRKAARGKLVTEFPKVFGEPDKDDD